MRFHDCILGLVIFISGLLICSVAITFPDQNDGKPGPWLFPTVLSLIFSLTGILLFIKGARSFKEHPLVSINNNISPAGVFNIFVVVALVVFYVMASEFLGFLICMELVMLVLMLLLKTRPVVAVIASAVATLAVYFIFAKCLLVPLPEGLFYF